jgi:hypothetical protein
LELKYPNTAIVLWELKKPLFLFLPTNSNSSFLPCIFITKPFCLKGARVFEFEQISHLLEKKTHQTVLEINLSAVIHNLKAYQQQLQPGVKLMAMVKAFSYGSGSFEIANLYCSFIK